MRNGQNKRMRGRNRNHKGHHPGGGHQNPLTRVYESNGPDVKIRGTAHHIAEKYLQLARDAQGSGDPVTAENHFQHAEHYYRLIAAAQDQFRQQNPYYQPPPASGESGRDDAFEDDDDGAQPSFGNGPNGNSAMASQGFNTSQPSYPREQPQPYEQRQPAPNQGRAPSQPRQAYQQPQPYPQPAQPSGGQARDSQTRNNQATDDQASDGERLPSFITGGGAAGGQGAAGAGEGNGERFPRRRRRHRNPRPDLADDLGASAEAGGSQGLRGESNAEAQGEG